MIEMFLAYLENEDQLICYLLIHCFIALAYENIDEIRILIDSVPENNSDVFKMMGYINDRYDKTLFDKLYQTAGIHKLSYKQNKRSWKNKNERTIYIHLLDM